MFSQAKKPIDHSVYDNRKSIENQVITNDGNYTGFSENIVIDEQGKQLAYTFSQDTSSVKSYELLYQNLKNNNSFPVLAEGFKARNSDLTVSLYGAIF